MEFQYCYLFSKKNGRLRREKYIFSWKKGQWLWPTSYKGRCLISLWLVFLYHSLIYYNLIPTSESGHEIKKGHGLNCQKKKLWQLSENLVERKSHAKDCQYSWHLHTEMKVQTYFGKQDRKSISTFFNSNQTKNKARKVYRFSDPDKKIIKHTNDTFMETFGM